VIVTCERCATQFQLDDSRVPARGVRVRCSRCKYAFRVVPAGQRAADEAAALARRAREDGGEAITQDMAEDSAGDSLSRAGVRRRPAPAPTPSTSEDDDDAVLDEESDWKFNEDVSGERDPRGQSGVGRERKPEPPEAPPPTRSGRLGDDWFHGGSDAPLELDDRPRHTPGSGPAEPAREAAPPEPEPEPQPEPVPVPQPMPQLRAEPPAEESFSPPLATESSAASEAATVGDDFQPGLEGLDVSGELATNTPERGGEGTGDSFDLLAAAEEAEAEQAVEAESAEPPVQRQLGGRSLGGDVVATVLRWLGYGAHGIGWAAVCALFGAGLYVGLAPAAKPSAVPDRVAGFELAALAGRYVENVNAGSLYVVSGRVRNPGSELAALRPLELELIDADGNPLDGVRAPLHAPSPTSALREGTSSELSSLPPLSGSIRPGEERSFEVVLPGLPARAAAFRVVEGDGRRR
jgi:predicted Zn finger-like uncharacterized protein